METSRRRYLCSRLFISLGVAAAFAFVGFVWQPGCLLQRITGVPCPTCGISRALFAALRLDFAAAFRWHPLFWLPAPVLAVAIWLPPANRRLAIWLAVAAGAAFLVAYGVRMLLLFPATPPMAYDPGSLLGRLF